VLAVSEGETTTMGTIERRFRCDICGARFPRVGLQTPRRTLSLEGRSCRTDGARNVVLGTHLPGGGGHVMLAAARP
jgi:hypothetical protein